MGYIEIPTRSIVDLNSSADINQLMSNDKAIQQNIIDVGDGIIESGSNSNGRWIKFRDGTMIQWGTTVQVTITSANGYIFIHNTLNIGYPVQFITAPVTESTAIWVSGAVSWCTNTNNSTNACNIAFASSVSGAECYGKWMAVGRWKA